MRALKNVTNSIANIVTGIRNIMSGTCLMIINDGKIINSNDAAHLVCNVLKDAIGIALDSEDQIYEEKFQREN